MNFLCISLFFDLLFLLFFPAKFVADTFWSTIMLKQINLSHWVKISIYLYKLSEKTQFALILYTKSHFEPFSVRRACTKSYITSEPYPRASQSWCQNVRETRKKIVIKCRGESFARCRVIVRNVEGGHYGPPPPSLIRVKVDIQRYFTLIIFREIAQRVHANPSNDNFRPHRKH